MAPIEPVRIAVIDDYDVIVEGAAALLRSHRDLVEVVECTVDGATIIRAVASHRNVGKAAVYTWADAPELIDAALAFGADGYVSKGLPGGELAAALVAIAAGEQVVRVGTTTPPAASGPIPFRRWPGQAAGLTERESEVLAHITQGRRTAEIAAAMYLSVNSIKTHTRNVFRKLGVSTRTEAALWGVDHGFRPDRSGSAAWSR